MNPEEEEGVIFMKKHVKFVAFSFNSKCPTWECLLLTAGGDMPMQVRRATQEEVGLIFNCCPAVDQNVSDQCRCGL